MFASMTANTSAQRAVRNRRSRFQNLIMWMLALWVSLILLFAVIPASAQDQQTPPQNQDNGKPKQDAPPEAGGPGGDMGPYAVPKKSAEAPPPPPPPSAKKVEGLPDYSIKVNVPLVNVDVLVTTKTGQFVPGLKADNFRLFEDGSAQQIANFEVSKAPITAVLLVEFASTNYVFLRDALQASYAFANTLRKDDWIAVAYYDMQPHILVDFTQDKKAVYGALNQLRIPGFAETNLFDALYDTLDRLDRVEGKKYVVLITTGVDTFSKLTLDKIMQKVKATPDITIFAVSTGGAMRAITEGRGGMGAQMRDMDYLQADNEMKTFASITGGMWFAPRFVGEMPDIFQQINQNIRSKYELVYHPSNPKQDGTYRKLRVELVDEEGQPLRIQDEKHKPLKYDIITRDGYRAKQQVE